MLIKLPTKEIFMKKHFLKLLVLTVICYSGAAFAFDSMNCPDNISLKRKHYKEIDESMMGQSPIIDQAIKDAKGLKEQMKAVSLSLISRGVQQCLYRGISENGTDRGVQYKALAKGNKLHVYFTSANSKKKLSYRVDINIEPINTFKVIVKTNPTRDSLFFVGAECADVICHNSSVEIGEVILDFGHFTGVNCVSHDIAMEALNAVMTNWSQYPDILGFEDNNGYTYDFSKLSDRNKYASTFTFTGYAYNTSSLHESVLSGNCDDHEGDFHCSLSFEMRCSGQTSY
jgi:hypothetical protein